MKKIIALLLLPILLLYAGCATVTTGTTQRVPVTTNPSGATVDVNTGYHGTTPCSFDLERNKNHILDITKAGYKQTQVVLRKTVCGSTAGNLLVGGVIGVGVDAMSGAIFKLTPEEVHVELEKE